MHLRFTVLTAWVALFVHGFRGARVSAGILYASEFNSPNPGTVYQLPAADQKVAIATGFGQPTEIAVDTVGDVYVTEIVGDRIRRITPDKVVQTVYTFDSAGDNPEGLGIGPDGFLYVSGTIDNPNLGQPKNLYRIDPVTGQATIYAAVGLQECLALDFDVDGNLFVTDLANGGTIWRVSPSHQVTALVSGLGDLTGLAIAPDGHTIYASTGFGNRIWKVQPDGRSDLFLTTNSPFSLAFDDLGNLYVGQNQDNGQILKIAPDGTQGAFASGFHSVRGLAFAVPEPGCFAVVLPMLFVGRQRSRSRRPR